MLRSAHSASYPISSNSMRSLAKSTPPLILSKFLTFSMSKQEGLFSSVCPLIRLVTVKKQARTLSCETLLFSCNADVLAWKSEAPAFCSWHILCPNPCNIICIPLTLPWLMHRYVAFICVLVYLTVTDTDVPCLLHRKTETAYAGE